MQNNGHILFTTPSTRSFLSKISGAKWVSYIVPHHVLLYEPVVLKRLLNACGFDQVKIMADIQWVPLSFLNERLSKLTGLLKGLTRYLKQQEQEGHQVFIPVSNGQMLVHARKLQLPGVHENEDPYRKNFLC
jgi:hypothetical protein